MPSFFVRSSTRLLVTAVFLASLAATAGTRTKYLYPSGGDDTSAIQAALNSCAASGPRCVVQLGPGKFYVGLIAVNNFRGTLKGAGIKATVLFANSNLQLIDPDNYWANPPGPTNNWPYLFTFVDGDIAISDLSIKVTDPLPFAVQYNNFFGYTYSLYGAITITGTAPTNSLIQRVSVEGLYKPGTGMPESTPILPYNLFVGVSVQGAIPTPAGDFIFLGGQHRLQDSFVKSSLVGFAAWYMDSAKVAIGGSEERRNQFENAGYAIEGEELMNSSQEISFNRVGGATGFGVNVLQDAGLSTPSQFSVHHNSIEATWAPPSVGYDDWGHRGISVWTDPAAQTISSADVSRNDLRISFPQPTDDQYLNAISVYGASIAQVNKNTVGGAGQRGIDISRTSGCAVLWNDVAEYSATISGIQLRSTTSECLVVGRNLAQTVVDEGTDNRLVDMGTRDQHAARTGATTPTASEGGGLAVGSAARETAPPRLRRPR